MGLKEELVKTIDNAGDALSEAGHRVTAGTEKATREAAGDTMTPGDKLGSVVNEGKENLLAGVDKAKVDIRNKT
jgi:hypothetical protein